MLQSMRKLCLFIHVSNTLDEQHTGSHGTLFQLPLAPHLQDSMYDAVWHALSVTAAAAAAVSIFLYSTDHSSYHPLDV